MALQIREIEVESFPGTGSVLVEDKKAPAVLQEAQKNLALKGCSVYAPKLEERLKGEPLKGRLISNTYALTGAYNALQLLNTKNTIRSDDADEIKDVKKQEALLIKDCLDNLQPLIKDVALLEYPFSEVKFFDATARKPASVYLDMRNDPLNIKLVQNNRQAMYKTMKSLTALTDYMSENSPGFQTGLVTALKGYTKNLHDKFDGFEVRQKIKTDEEILADFQKPIELLIKDDSQSEFKVDRSRAEQDLARKLAVHGLDLVRVPINEGRSPEEEMINQAKTCVLRASWDGFIERPQSTDMLSPALKSVLHKGLDKVDPKLYNLQESPIWQICEQVPEFAAFKFDVQKGLAREGFPPEKIKELSYSDIAYIINVEHQPTSKAEERFQRRNIARADAVRFQSAREKSVKQFVQNHEKDLQIMMAAQGKSKDEISRLLADMKKGKSPLLDGHHNFAISDPNFYEKESKKAFTDMNRQVVSIDKSVHRLVHMLENNVNGAGRVIPDGAKSSFRTVFKDKKSGQKFYYAIRVKEGIEAVMGFNYQVVYNKDYLSSQTFERPQEQALDQQKDPLQAARNRASSLQERKGEKDKVPAQPYKRENPVSRPNHRGLQAFGGRRNNLGNRPRTL